MPILWRYLICYFLKIVVICVAAFVAILLTMRLDDIAHFATLGASLSAISLFALYQVPYILPIALPVACLIASLILFQRLSSTHELTALRACGYSLNTILAPILVCATLLSLLNFWVSSELATHSHLQTNLLKSQLRSINPLLLLNNKHLMRSKGYYFDALGPSRMGETASDVVFVTPNPSQGRLTVIISKHFKSTPTLFTGDDVTLIMAAKSQEKGFDQLLVENMRYSETNVQDFSNFLQQKIWTINNDYLQMPLLLARLHEQQQQLDKAIKTHEDKQVVKQLTHQMNKSFSEIIKRMSIGFAVFSFTLMGASFGMSIRRDKRSIHLFTVIGLSTFYLISFFIGKEIEHQKLVASSLFIFPHFVILFASYVYLKRLARGKES